MCSVEEKEQKRKRIESEWATHRFLVHKQEFELKSNGKYGHRYVSGNEVEKNVILR